MYKFCSGMPIKYIKLSDYKIKKILNFFCSDTDATETTEILVLNRKTVNRYFRIFREAIPEKQQRDLSVFFGEVELDEAYFGAKRLRGVNMPQKRGKVSLESALFTDG